MCSAHNNKNKQAPGSNNNKNAVLDTSALMALLLGEISMEHASEILKHACVSSVTLCKILSEFHKEGGDAAAMLTQLQKLDLDIRSFDAEQVALSIHVLNSLNGEKVSSGDRAAIALATALNFSVFTKNIVWADSSFPIHFVRI